MKTEESDMGQVLAALVDEMKVSRKHMEADRKTLVDDLARVFRQTAPHPVAPQPALYRPTTTYNNNTTGCFYCSEEDHRKDNCPHRAIHFEKGYIIIDQNGRTKLADGRPIPINSGSNAKERVEIVAGVRTSNSAQKSSALLQGNGVLSLAQVLSTAPLTQDKVVEILDNMDMEDVIQYLSVRHNWTVTEDEGF